MMFAQTLAAVAALTLAASPLFPGTAWGQAGAARAALPERTLPEPAVVMGQPGGNAMAFLRCMAERRAPLSSGHRGGPVDGFPENALETFAHTLAQGPMLIETDVRTSRDGVLVLMHDETLERTSTGAGRVGDHDWVELATLRLKDQAGGETAFRMPTLAQALAWMRGRGVLVIDLKEDESLPAIIQAVADADARGYAVLNTYRPSQAMLAHRLDPELSLMHPVDTVADLEVLERLGVDIGRIGAWTGIDGIDVRRPALWAELDRRGIPVTYATLFVSDPKMAETGDWSPYLDLADAGVDILATDHHLEAMRMLATTRDAPGAATACHGAAR